MNKRIISLLFIMILAVGMVGIQTVSATGTAKDNYSIVYPNFPVPNGCGPNLCHSNDKPSITNVTNYGKKLQTLAGGPGKFKPLNATEKQKILKQAGSGVNAQLGINPLEKDIDIETVGHYTLTLTTNVDVDSSGQLTWKTDDQNITAGIDAAPSGQSGSITISKSSTCVGSPQVCTATFDIQVKPLNGITPNTAHSIILSAFNNTNTGEMTAVVTAGINPVPELATGILMAAGLIGLVGLVRYKKK